MLESPASRCLSEQDIDGFVLNRLSGEALEAVEEHLLICPACQAAAEQELAFVRAFRAAAARESRRKRSRPWRWGMMAGLAAGLALVFWLARSAPERNELAGEPVLVALHAYRGLPLDHAGKAAAGRPFTLSFDVAELAPRSRFGIELAGADGGSVYRTSAAAGAGKLELTVRRKLAPGVYWVRLYDGGELLREYALRLE